MDKYEFKLKVDEMKALVSARNYNAAAEIAETINWRKIRNLNALVLAGEVFEQVGRYEDSKEILLMAYDKSPIGRNIIYRLAEISIKTKRFDEAQEYYDEFVDIAPHDNLKFVLKYKMTAAQGLPYKEQIKILEELKEQEYSEEWAYELAYLYYKDMQPEKCVEACDELILWFGDGIYVEKALELKMHYQPLTKPQEEKYRIFRQKRTGVIEVKPNDFLESGEIVHEAVQIPSVQTNTGQYNTANLQEEIARGMQQINTVRMQNVRNGIGQGTESYTQRRAQQEVSMQQNVQEQPRVSMQQNMQEQPEVFIQQNLQEQPKVSMQQNLQEQPEVSMLRNLQERQKAYVQQNMQDPYMGQQVQQNPYRGQQFEQDPYMQQQFQQNLYTMDQIQQTPYMEQQQNAYVEEPIRHDQIQQSPYMEQQQNAYIEEPVRQSQMQQLAQNTYLKQEEEWQASQEQDPVPVMTMEEIQAEWEKTKQAMNDALHKVEGPEQEASKEKSLVEAERLMQQLLGIIPQLAEKTAQQELSDKHPGKVQNDLEQAGRIVAGINQLLQKQIDSLQAEEEKKQDPLIHEVSDPTREMPQLPENMVEGKEIGAINKVKMNGNSLKKVSSNEDDNPVMSAWKEAPPGISAIDLLQRVRMEKTAANAMEQSANAANPVSKVRTQDAVVNPNLIQQMQTENPVMKSMQQVQTENPVMESIQQVQTENPVMESIQQVQADNSTLNPIQENPIKNSAVDFAPQIENEEENAVTQTEYSAENAVVETENPTENIGIGADYTVDHAAMQAKGPAENEGIEARNVADNMYMESEYLTDRASVEAGSEFSPEYTAEYGNYNSEDSSEYTEQSAEYLSENNNMEIRQDYSLENKERDAEPKFESEQENLFLAAKPRFLTQAQLQAGSVMDGKKNTQVTKEFSREAMAAARSTGFQENVPQADGQNYMEEMKKLTEEQKQIFSYFVPIAGMEAQIYDLLIGVSEHLQYDKHAQSGNIIIEGISGSGKTVLIMDIIKVLQKEIKRPVGKTGKIEANALNQKDLDVLIDKISGGCLIIESAGKISRETAVKLSACMEKDHTGTLYILEDTEEGIQKALERDSSFAAKFTEKISIPLFSSDELVEFGKAYANDLNYDIDEMGVLALYKRIGAIQKLDHVTTLTEVKEIVDEAIDHAEKGVLKKVFGMLTATRANDDNYIILREKDFEE